MMPTTAETYGPAQYHLADWRRRVQDLYSEIRSSPDPARAHRLWLHRRSALFRSHPLSPLPAEHRKGFGGLQAYAYDPALRFHLSLMDATPEEVHYDLGAEGSMTATRIAMTHGMERPLGQELSVFWINGYGGGLFLPFKDATSGQGTYGGGRYLIDAIKGADLGLDDKGNLILDFNFAYTPSCAWNLQFVCPLAPLENMLAIGIKAGEKMDRG